MNERERRGIIIASKSAIKQKGGVWLAPSQSGNSRSGLPRSLKIRTAHAPTMNAGREVQTHLRRGIRDAA